MGSQKVINIVLIKNILRTFCLCIQPAFTSNYTRYRPVWQELNILSVLKMRTADCVF
jgi:hypothetical protein